MSEIKVGKWFNLSVKYITPIALIVILAFTLNDEIKNPYEGYPVWALLTGFEILIATPIVALILSKIPPKDKDYYKSAEIELEEGGE